MKRNTEETEGICSLIEDNLYEFYFRIAGLSGLDHNRDSVPMFIRNDPGRWPAFILGSVWEQEGFLEQISDGIRSGIYPPFWITREPDEPNAFFDRAREYGIRPVNRWTGMGLSADDFLDDPVSLPDMEIQKMRVNDLPGWTTLVNKEVFRRDALTADMVSLMKQDPSLSFYCGLKGGRMVSTILAFMDHRTAGLYLLSTDAGFRRLGIGKAMMVHAVKDCFSRGADRIVLHGTRDGENIYKKLGFRGYCYFDILWYFS